MKAINIPEKCGVILLSDTTLFPHGGLPLFIFEPRYRRMIEDSINGDCLFCVGRLLQEEVPGNAPNAAAVGTIGLIRASREQQDGTSNLLLHGVIRVRFTRWLLERDYPLARIEPVISIPPPEEQESAAMKTLRAAVEDAIAGLPVEIRDNVNGLLDRADSAALMTDIVSQQFVHHPDLRQRLLEEDSVAARIPLLCEYLREATAE